jgi:hypothetical protein
MLLVLILGMFSMNAHAQAVDVSFLTPSGSVPLKTWTIADLKSIAKPGSQISAQKLLFDESAAKLDLNDRADIDLVTITGDHVGRVPRFMVWRGYLKFKLNRDGSLSSSAGSNRLLVPTSIFSISKITKIELGRASLLYPTNELHSRTNPAASRGEKLFAQSCLACHGLSASPLPISALSDERLKSFPVAHQKFGIALDARALRGIVAYRDALVLEQSQVKSIK